MKKITLITIFFIGNLSTFAQETETKKKQAKHEIGIDVLDVIGLKKLEFSYDYLLNESETIGADISYFPDNDSFIDNEGFQDSFSMSLNYKHYFSKKYTQGFYAEVIASYNRGKAFLKDPTTSNFLTGDFKRYNAIGAGFGIGYKYVSKRNFFIDANININRNINNSLNSNENYNFPKAISNLGITIGKRF